MGDKNNAGFELVENPQRRESGMSVPGLPGQNINTAGPVEDDKQKLYFRAKAAAERFGESYFVAAIMSIFTIWALYQDDIKNAGTTKEADTSFEVIISILFFTFLFEIALQSFYKEDYCHVPIWEAVPGEDWKTTWYRRIQFGSFYFWLDFIATLSLLLDMPWLIGQEGYDTISGGGVQSAQAGRASQTGARAARVVRVVRMVRLVRMVKLYKYASAAIEKDKKARLKAQQHANGVVALPTEEEDEESAQESKVGAAMSDLTNRRVIVLILMMLIIIPLLTTTDPDISLSLGVQVVHRLAELNATDPTTYSSGLTLALETVMARLPLIYVEFNGINYYRNNHIYDERRTEELSIFELNNNFGNFSTKMAYDQKHEFIQSALYSIYTTSFIIVLLISGTYFFSRDVNRLVITPIERLVDLVRKISANPLGVEYKMLGEKDGFVEGMETTMLLTTIMKIGALMRVGFGEAGASIIAKNLNDGAGGKLNLMGSGVMIRSIFGFCDVRQFTDTTECLQEEVMLFVNRIAHILHSIVVQCSGAANKNIGDAFLLTWKLDEKLSPEQVSNLADQALLTFCKALIELSRYQDFITNFSVAATARLYRRFPDYNVRIGSGLHVGWAIEGAIGSNRKIDASYLSPHVSATEFLESSTKAYGVALLISEPFYRLLSPAAARVCRQVDRIRRSAHEEPMGLYTYDSDLTINWNDPHRVNKQSARDRLRDAARRVTQAQGTHTAEGGEAGHHHHHHHHHAPVVGPSAGAAAAAAGGTAVRRKSGVGDALQMQPLQPQSVATLHNRRASQQTRPTNPPAAHSASHSAAHALPSLGEDAHGDAGALDGLEAAESAEQRRLERQKQTPTITVVPYTQAVWNDDADLVELRHRVNDSFRVLWEQGITAYIKGDWQKARDIFHETMRMSKNKDGPSKFLIDVIDEHGGTAPSDWPGYRDEGAGGH